MIDLAAVYLALEAVRERGALEASATFLTAHGLVDVVSGPDGRCIRAHGTTLELDDSERAA